MFHVGAPRRYRYPTATRLARCTDDDSLRAVELATDGRAAWVQNQVYILHPTRIGLVSELRADLPNVEAAESSWPGRSTIRFKRRPHRPLGLSNHTKRTSRTRHLVEP